MTSLEQPPATAEAIHLPANVWRIVLTGFMGAGKTTVGRALADRLGWTFLDLDQHLEQRTGYTIPDIFLRHGEPHFRRLESSALASALASASTVIALGGGTPEVHANRLLLEQTPGTLTVFLDAPFPILFDRCLLQAMNPGATERPVLRDPAAAHSRFLARQPLYRRLAHITQETEALTSAETVSAILMAFASLKTSR